jgi:hypothetical protein
MYKALCLPCLIAALVWVPACKPHAPSSAGPVTVRLTWMEYDGTGDPERAVYCLDGTNIGRGSMGFVALMLRLQKLPIGSTMEVITGFPPMTASGPDRCEPFSASWGDWDHSRYGILRQVTRERKIRVTLDGKDYPIDDPIDWDEILHPPKAPS